MLATAEAVRNQQMTKRAQELEWAALHTDFPGPAVFRVAKESGKQARDHSGETSKTTRVAKIRS